MKEKNPGDDTNLYNPGFRPRQGVDEAAVRIFKLMVITLSKIND